MGVCAGLLLAGLTLSGSVEADARIGFPADEPARIVRNENTLWLRGEANPSDTLEAVVDLELVHVGTPAVTRYSDLSARNRLEPFRLESDALWLGVSGLASDRVYIRAGRQILPWGATAVVGISNFMNALDLEDPLELGEPIAHEMLLVEVDAEVARISAVAAPVFTPALLPAIPVADLVAYYAPAQYRGLLATLPDELDLDVRARTPAPTLSNVPLALRADGSVAGIDWALTHYAGREDLPALRSVTITEITTETVTGSATLQYPAVRVTSAELSSAPPWLPGVTVWAEGAWVLPRPLTLVLETPAGVTGIDQLTEPYPLALVGGDWQVGGSWIVGVQYNRGLYDELGADRVGDYAFAWTRGSVLRDRLDLRLVAGASLNDGSGVILPEVTWHPADAVGLTAGGYVLWGAEDSKFASPLAGPSVAYLRARVWF